MAFTDNFKLVKYNSFTVIKIQNKKLREIVFMSIMTILFLLAVFLVYSNYYIYFIIIFLILLAVILSNYRGETIFAYPHKQMLFLIISVLGVLMMISGTVIVIAYRVLYDKYEKNRFNEFEDFECSYNSSMYYRNEMKAIGYGVLKLTDFTNYSYYLQFGRNKYLGRNKTKEELLSKYGSDKIILEKKFTFKFDNVFYQNKVNIYYYDCKFNSKNEEFKICYQGTCIYDTDCDPDEMICITKKHPNPHEILAWIGVGIAISGFIMMFVGISFSK